MAENGETGTETIRPELNRSTMVDVQGVKIILVVVFPMYSKLAIEIGVLDIKRLAFSPSIKTHLLYQAKIKNLRVMSADRCFIRIGVKMVAGKVSAFMTKCDALLAGAVEYNARFTITPKGYDTSLISASTASCRIKRQIESLCDICPERHVFVRKVHRTIETIQSTWRRHLLIIHTILILACLLEHYFC